MKRYKIYIRNAILASCVLIMSGTIQAQEKRFNLDVNYSVSGATGGFKDFVGKTSWNGWQASLMYKINDRLSVGLGTGFQDYYEQFPRQVYKLNDGGDISAVVTNSLQTIPLLAQARYNLMPEGILQPYVGLGLGGNMILFNQHLGEFSNGQNDFGFAARPQLGVLLPFGKSKEAGLNLVGSYNFMPYNKNGLDDLNNWSVGLGICVGLK